MKLRETSCLISLTNGAFQISEGTKYIDSNTLFSFQEHYYPDVPIPHNEQYKTLLNATDDVIN